MNDDLFIEPSTLMSKIDNINLKILDATFYLPDSGLIAEEEYKKKHIPNAIFFDINKIADPNNSLPHMIPSKDLFSKMMQNIGLNKDDEIIIYDNSPFLSSARAWFLFRYFGHDKIFIMQGGVKNWENNGGNITNGNVVLEKGNYIASAERKELVVNLDQMILASQNKENVILDARSRKRFLGEALEPRPNLPSGHIPNSQSLPSSDLINKDGYLKSKDEINQIFSNIKVNTNDKIIATCGSGVSACVISIALFCLGKKDIPIYDGSWTEWASSGQEIKTN
ncbi:sulfurtransferase [Alphaproteobacteria bacterium]|jgi:thiosulfate/3-mercaptopyruvate sulfurtransferase|nr:sulfurtransferase [Alphaproteobacteria bacterium]